MSVVGTGVAAGVAQSSLQAQEVARRRDRAARESRDASRHVAEVFEQHIRGLQENDDDGSAAHLNVDTNTSGDHEDPVDDALSSAGSETRDRLELLSRQGRPPATADDVPAPLPRAATPPAAAAPSDDEPPPLYQHVDVQA